MGGTSEESSGVESDPVVSSKWEEVIRWVGGKLLAVDVVVGRVGVALKGWVINEKCVADDIV